MASSGADQLWLFADQRLPAWDQADYLNSAVDHGRVLGLLPGGGWQGWHSLLDLSPKIPPLSSLISGTVMAVAGETADQASWVLSLWNGVLLIVVACWGRQLGGAGMGLLAATLVAIAPALMELRVDFTLDMPLAASTTLALWLLGRWQRAGQQGGRWPQAILAGLAIGMALLVKQSALLMLAPPALWASWHSLHDPKRRWQSFIAIMLVLAMVFPWLHHNWITTLGGTSRAVFASGAEEGDPGSLDPRSLIWYPPLFPKQLGLIPWITAMAGLLMMSWRQRKILLASWPYSLSILRPGWPWLIGCCLSGWLFISLSPNKDARYITPLLPLLSLVLARCWWSIGEYLNRKFGRKLTWILLSTGLVASGGCALTERVEEIKPYSDSPVVEVIKALRKEVGTKPTTLVMAASDPELNEHTLSYLGRSQGGGILARRFGRNPKDDELALAQSNWWILATGNQGTSRKTARALSKRVRQDERFERLQSWRWSKDQDIELWRRKASAPKTEPFDQRFIDLAKTMQDGPKGLEKIFESIGPWHMLDPHFSYQKRVRSWALHQLERDPRNRDALWSLALIAVLKNRPEQADHWFRELEQLDGKGHWATAYRSVVLLANWNGCQTARIADTPPHQNATTAESTVLNALRDLGRSLCFDARGPIGLSRSIPDAVESLQQEIELH